MQNKIKKGLSQVITTALFISLSLLVIGIFWGVVKNTINLSPEATCNPALRNYEIKIISACYETTGEIRIVLKRGIDNQEINPLQFTFSNGEKYQIIGEKCIDVRTADKYGKTCEILSSGEQKEYFFNSTEEKAEVVLLEAVNKKEGNNFCGLDELEIKDSC